MRCTTAGDVAPDHARLIGRTPLVRGAAPPAPQFWGEGSGGAAARISRFLARGISVFSQRYCYATLPGLGERLRSRTRASPQNWGAGGAHRRTSPRHRGFALRSPNGCGSMRCPNPRCGRVIPATARYCAYCGARAPVDTVPAPQSGTAKGESGIGRTWFARIVDALLGRKPPALLETPPAPTKVEASSFRPVTPTPIPTPPRRRAPTQQRTLQPVAGAWSLAKIETISVDNVARLERVAVIGAGHAGGGICFSPDGRLLATGSDFGMVGLWEVASGREVRSFKDQFDRVHSVAFSPDGHILASASATLTFWDVTTGREIGSLRGHRLAVQSVTFSGDGSRLASGSKDGTARVWDVASRTQLWSLFGYGDPVASVTFSPDGHLLAAAAGRRAQVWEASSAQRIQTLEHHATLTSALFGADGNLLAAGSTDGSVALWDLSSKRLFRSLSGHMDAVQSIAFSSDVRLLASGSADRTVKLWDVGGARERVALPTASPVNAVVFIPSGRMLAVGQADGDVAIWAVRSL